MAGGPGVDGAWTGWGPEWPGADAAICCVDPERMCGIGPLPLRFFEAR